ncbi:MAG: hypothetical protein ACTSO7_12050 [Candidatus Heimdallarchaeota archaeon]
MKKRYFVLISTILVFASISGVLNFGRISNVAARSQSMGYELFEENFNSAIPQNDWTFAHQEFFSLDYYNKKEGSALRASGTTGQEYDGVQYAQSFYDGSIEGWVYPYLSSSQKPALWIRASGFATSSDPSFASGYMLCLNGNYAYLYRVDDGTLHQIWSDWIGDISNQWWHLKLEIIDSTLKLWVINDYDFMEPDYIRDLANDAIIYDYGCAGLSADTDLLTSIRFTCFDLIKIKYFAETIEENFDEDLRPDWLDYAHESFYGINDNLAFVKEGSHSLVVTPSSSSGQTYDGVQYDCNLADGSIEAWFKPIASNYLIPALWIRTSGFSSSTNPSFTTGYFMRMYVNKVGLYRRDDGGSENLGLHPTGYYRDKWWHLKLKATGTLIEAWITQDDTFSVHPQMSHNTESDTVKYSNGKVGFSSRTTMPNSAYKTYIDGIKVTCNRKVPSDPQPVNSNLWAIIIDAGYYEPYWTRDAFGLYKTLTYYYGLDKAQTYLLTSLTEIDNEIVPRYIETTHMNIHDVFKDLAGKVNSETDNVIIWWGGHGTKLSVSEARFNLGLGGGGPDYTPYVTENNFDDYLDLIDCNEMYVFLGSCYSGLFLDETIKSDNRVIYTSCGETTAHHGDPIGHADWPYATYCSLNPYLNLYEADIDSNGMVSLLELFQYCELEVLDDNQYPQKDTGNLNDANIFLSDYIF